MDSGPDGSPSIEGASAVGGSVMSLAWGGLLLLGLGGAAGAAEFRSVAEPAAVLYDAPSLKATKVLILGAGYPVEVVVSIEGWLKVRDEKGSLVWAEAGRLIAKRTVLARAATDLREGPDDGAKIVFRVDAGVALEFVEQSGPWAKLRHRDGETGYARVNGFWGL